MGRRMGGDGGATDAELPGNNATLMRGGEPFDPSRHGFVRVHLYALYFWRPYLGNTAFSLWELLLSYCFGENDIAFPSLSRLARTLTNSDHSRAVVSGRRRSGGRSAGALAVLEREGLVEVQRQGSGPRTRYRFRVVKALPLLRPDQVARLSPVLQADHIAWLQRLGVNEGAYERAWQADLGSGAARGSAGAKESLDLTLPADVPDTRPEHQGSTNKIQEEEGPEWWWQRMREYLEATFGFLGARRYTSGSRVIGFADGLLTVEVQSQAALHALGGRMSSVFESWLPDFSGGLAHGVHIVLRADGRGSGKGTG